MNELDLSNSYEREEAEEQKKTRGLLNKLKWKHRKNLLRHRLKRYKQKTQPKDGPDFLGDLRATWTDKLGVQNPAEGGSINDMGGKARSVAGVVDTVMDLTSKFHPCHAETCRLVG